MKMRWDDVRVFLALTRTPGMRDAARSLGVNASTLSRRLNTLEEALGHPLFQRTPEGLLLTKLGQTLLPQAIALEHAHLSMERFAASWEQRIEGMVRLSMTPAMLRYIIAPGVPDFLDRHPGLSLDLLSSIEIADILRQDVDISLCHVRPSHTELLCKRVGRTAYGIYGSQSYVQAHGPLHHVDQVRWVGWPESLSFLSMAQWFETNHITPSIRLHHYTEQIEMVKLGGGLFICPIPLAEHLGLKRMPLTDELEAKITTPPGDETWIVTHETLRHIPRVATVWEHLCGVLEAIKPPSSRG